MKSLVIRDGETEEISGEPRLFSLGSHSVMGDQGRQYFDIVLQEPVRLLRLFALCRVNDPMRKLGGVLPELRALNIGRLGVPLWPGLDDGSSARYRPLSLELLDLDVYEAPFLAGELLKCGVVQTGLRIFAEVVNPGPSDCWVSLFVQGVCIPQPPLSRNCIMEDCDQEKYEGSEYCEPHLQQQIEEDTRLWASRKLEVEVVELCSVLGCGQPSTNDKTAPFGYCATHTPAGDQ